MKKNWPLRIFFLLVFAAMSAFVFYTIYSLSDEDGYTSGYRSETVTQTVAAKAGYGTFSKRQQKALS